MKESKLTEFYFEDDTKSRQLPQPIDHINKSYSLENDMVLGWVPTQQQEEMISVQFYNELNDHLIEFYNQNDPNKIVYLGYRPNEAMQFHKQFSAQSNYKMKNSKNYKVKQSQNQQLFVGMNPNFEYDIKFNSQFESGNLDLAIQKSELEYDLYMRVDTNTKGHTLWYYFEVTGLKNIESIKFNICNFRKKRCLYERGMKPYIQRDSQDWQQEGENVKYGAYKCQFKEIQKQYYCLTFTIMNKKKDDKIRIAYCIPYTFSKLNNFLKSLNSQYMEQSFFCYSLSGVQIPKLTFSKGNILKKKIVVIQARIHPGESNSSWVMQGLLEYLSSSQAEKLLDQLIFVIVPMMNVDGVIFGNYRTGCAGRDLNRQFRDSCKKLYPTVYAMKQLISDLYQVYGDQIVGFIDIHGHSAKKNAFLYGPEFQLWNCNYYKSRLFAKILSLKTQIFRYYSCLFRINKCKVNTARAVFCEKYDFVNCFTLEVSNSSYYYEQNTENFTEQKWIQFGQIFGESFNDFIIHFQEIDTLFCDFKDKKVCKQTKKKYNNQINEEKQLNLQKICQNSKYSELFDEMKNDEPNLSFSEGESDSERESDDLDDEILNNVVLTSNKQKKIKKSKKSLKVNDYKKQSIRSENNSAIHNHTVFLSKKQFLEDQPNNIFQQTQNQNIYRRTSYKQYKQEDKIKDNQTFTLTSKNSMESSNIKTFRASYISGIQPKIEQMSTQNRNKSPIKLKTLIHEAKLRGQSELNCEINEENMADQIFEPYIKRPQFNQTNNKNIKFGNICSPTKDFVFLNELNTKIMQNTHFPTDQGCTYNVTAIYHGINKHQKKPNNYKFNKMQKFQKTQNPSINLRNTLQVQKLGTTEDSFGIIIKPKLFSSPQIDEALGQTEQSKSAMNQYQNSSISQKPQKQLVPSSFYSIKKHWTNTRGIQQYLNFNN
ncbi:unnamed protein product [Paramecium primaurelia]|uniref:Peptidase M14 domain-containing protein n=1 Tax=Paramecium primaurelia TaxID=5886 RepID=A0A8S1P324_PARPR|nr:unnamed protein product [Paramecium primaurelia]